MTHFAYLAMDGAGRRRRGRMQAQNLSELELRLRHAGLDFIDARTASAWRLATRKPSRRGLANFCFQLHQLLDAGVPLLDALIDLGDSAETPGLSLTTAALIASLQAGKSFSSALAEHPESFDGVFRSLVHAGEVSGRLPQMLEDLSESLRWQDEIAAHTKKLLIQPAVSGVIVMAVFAFVLAVLVPQLGGFIKAVGQEIPFSTRLLFGLSDFFARYAGLLFGAIAAGLTLFVWQLRTRPALRLRIDGWIWRLPIGGGILEKILLARFANTLALLYAAGTPIIEALHTSQHAAGNARLAAAIRNSTQRVEEGQGLTEAFRSNALFPPLVIRMLRIGESTGALDRTLGNVAYFYTRDAREAIQRLQALIEPATTLVIGALLAWVMLSVLGPIYDIITRMQPT